MSEEVDAAADRSAVYVAHRERVLNEVPLVYDADHTMSTGYWSHDCGSEFFGGGEALHNPGCPIKDYEGCIYNFGPKEVERAKEWATTHDEDYPTPLGVVTVGILKAKFPELL